MVCVFCLLVCAPTDIALGLLFAMRGVLCTHAAAGRSACVIHIWKHYLTVCLSCISCWLDVFRALSAHMQFSFLSLRPTFVIDFATLSIQMLYSVYCQLSHSLAVVWAVTHPVAIALCENSFDSIKCILGSPAFKCAINTQMSRHSHSTTDIYTLCTSNGLSTRK